MASCELCDGPIEGTPFALSSLTERPRTVEVCQRCAEADWITKEQPGVTIHIWRDDLIRADEDRLRDFLDDLLGYAEDGGWTIPEIRLRARSDKIMDPVDDVRGEAE